MNLTTEKKNELLDYAVERINQYDGHLDKISAATARNNMEYCRGCHLTDDGWNGRDCSICPFAIDMSLPRGHAKCRPKRQFLDSPKEHQNDLIKAANNWCEKFYPEYEVVRV